MSVRTAVFPGTFDPFTNGHLDLTRRAARLFDRVVVAVADSNAKGTLFSLAERAEMIRAAVKGMRHVEVTTFSDLVVAHAKQVDAQVMIRGLRAVSDFEFEFQMALMNRRLSRSLEVAFLMPSQQYTYLNSTLVKEIARLGGPVRGLVPRSVETMLYARVRPAGRTAAASPAGAAKVKGLAKAKATANAKRPAKTKRPAPAKRGR